MNESALASSNGSLPDAARRATTLPNPGCCLNEAQRGAWYQWSRKGTRLPETALLWESNEARASSLAALAAAATGS